MTLSFLRSGPARQKTGRWQWVHVILGLLLIAGMAVGCGGGDGGNAGSSETGSSAASSENGGQPAAENSAASQPLQACDLLTTADVEAILGATVDEPRQTSRADAERQFWMSQCDYYAPQQERGAGLMVQSSANADPVKALEAHVTSLKDALGDAYEAQTIAGVGGAALWDGSVKQLTVFDGGHMLIVTVTGAGEEGAALETAKALAAQALARLP